MKRFEVISTDCESDSWIDNADQIKGAFDYRIIEQILDEWDERIKALEKENMKLQEQLKNAIVPKFKVGDEVFYIDKFNKVASYEIHHIEGLRFRYCDKDGHWLYEESLFPTEADAQKYLEEHK